MRPIGRGAEGGLPIYGVARITTFPTQGLIISHHLSHYSSDSYSSVRMVNFRDPAVEAADGCTCAFQAVTGSCVNVIFRKLYS